MLGLKNNDKLVIGIPTKRPTLSQLFHAIYTADTVIKSYFYCSSSGVPAMSRDFGCPDSQRLVLSCKVKRLSAAFPQLATVIVRLAIIVRSRMILGSAVLIGFNNVLSLNCQEQWKQYLFEALLLFSTNTKSFLKCELLSVGCRR